MPENNAPVHLEGWPPDRLERRLSSVVDITAVASERSSDLRVAWRVLMRRRWTVLTILLVATTLAAIISFKVQRIYEAVARVEVEADTPQIQSLTDLYRSVPSDDTFLETQVNVVESDNLAWRTIEQVGLQDNSEFAPRPGRSAGPHAETIPTVQTALIRTFHNHLSVDLVRNTRMLEVRFESVDPQLAARVANALVSNYLEYNFRVRYDATRQASGWMAQQLDELKAKVEKSQQALVDYERQNSIVNISDKQSVAEQRLEELTKDLTVAETDRMQKESLYSVVNSNESQVPIASRNDLLQRFEEKLADLKGLYVDALGEYGPNFPKVVRLREQVDALQATIEKERKRLVERIRGAYLAALGREKLVTAAVAREKVGVERIKQLSIGHNLLKREFETNQQLYESLLQRLKDATVSAGLRATNIHVVDQAIVPAFPVRPKKALNIGLAFLGGLLVGVMLAFVQEALDASIKNSEDVERLMSSPALAVIPHTNLPIPKSSWWNLRAKTSSGGNGIVELTVLQHPTSAMSESFRVLRSSILLATPSRPPQVLLVTSAQPSEGKTLTALNLALTLAQRDARVALIDGDLRKPGIGMLMGMTGGKGLSGILTGAHGLDEALRPFKAVPTLSVLASGQRPPNPADLLSSSTMRDLIQTLRQRFDHVVVDSPPALLVTDAVVLSPLADGVILIAESGVTTRVALARAHAVVANAGGRILGIVLNKMDYRRDGYSEYYYNNYYYTVYYRDGMSKMEAGIPAPDNGPSLSRSPKR